MCVCMPPSFFLLLLFFNIVKLYARSSLCKLSKATNKHLYISIVRVFHMPSKSILILIVVATIFCRFTVYVHFLLAQAKLIKLSF